MKYFLMILIALVVIGGGVLLYQTQTNEVVIEPESTTETEPEDSTNLTTEEEPTTEPTATEPESSERTDQTVIGTSVEGTDIVAYHFGSGDTELLLVGGTHGGYSPNTAELAEEFISYFAENSSTIPQDVMVTVIPALNPDGLDESGAAGRFNANNVDLNRNFACEWSSEAVWQNQTVSGGDNVFSEPEAIALRNYVQTYTPENVIVWFSQEGKVYPSACGGTPSTDSVELAATFASSAGYPAEAEFDAYAITGDMVNWMASEGIPAISVLLSNHTDTEWTKNRAGVDAILNQYAE